MQQWNRNARPFPRIPVNSTGTWSFSGHCVTCTVADWKAVEVKPAGVATETTVDRPTPDAFGVKIGFAAVLPALIVGDVMVPTVESAVVNESGTETPPASASLTPNPFDCVESRAHRSTVKVAGPAPLLTNCGADNVTPDGTKVTVPVSCGNPEALAV